MANAAPQQASLDIRVMLLIEDNPGDAQLVSELLEQQPRDRYKIVHVPAISAAVQALQSSPIDVIVLDLDLPDGKGVDVVKAVREAAAEVPIVVLTGLENEEVALACIDAGAQVYMPKSEVRAQNLIRAIGYAVSRRREAQLRELQRTLAHYRSMTPAGQSTTVTAALSGTGAVSIRSPATYSAIVQSYFGLLEPYLLCEREQVVAPRETMERIITTLGDAAGGPRDLLEVHVAALDRALSLYDDSHSRTIVFEARLLAVEMMGLLVDYYRVGLRRREPQGLSS
jgi:DNA-binding NarL/FixJ family response regulator